MLNRLISKLIGGALAASLATAGIISGYQHKKKADYNQLFEATKDYAMATDEFRLNPKSSVKELAKQFAEVKLAKLMKKRNIENLSIEHRWHKVLYFSYTEQGIKHFYAGKIGKVSQIGNTTVYITEQKNEDFNGFSIPSINGKGQEIISMRYGDRGGAINIDLYSLRRHAELRGHIRKGWSLPKNSLEATLRHELTHAEEGGNEVDAFSVELEYCNKNGGCPFLEKDLKYLASMKNPKGSEKEYHETAIKVLNKYKNVKSVPEYAEKLQRIEKKIKEGKRFY